MVAWWCGRPLLCWLMLCTTKTIKITHRDHFIHKVVNYLELFIVHVGHASLTQHDFQSSMMSRAWRSSFGGLSISSSIFHPFVCHPWPPPKLGAATHACLFFPSMWSHIHVIHHPPFLSITEFINDRRTSSNPDLIFGIHPRISTKQSTPHTGVINGIGQSTLNGCKWSHLYQSSSSKRSKMAFKTRVSRMGH